MKELAGFNSTRWKSFCLCGGISFNESLKILILLKTSTVLNFSAPSFELQLLKKVFLSKVLALKNHLYSFESVFQHSFEGILSVIEKVLVLFESALQNALW